jgi:AhpD family alkylhydroperoxidase
MADAVARVALRRAIGQIRYRRPVPPGRADPPTAEIYRQLEADFGMLAPPIALHAAVPELLAASWLMLRESLVADAVLPRSDLEAVAAAVSAGNACPYCVTVHRATEQALPGTGRSATVQGWSRLVAHRDTASRPPGTAAEAARLVGVVTTFHYLNRLVNVFLSPSPLPSAVPGVLATPMLQVLGRFTGGHARRPHSAGESLRFLPTAPGQPPPAWAAADPILGEAFARAEAESEGEPPVERHFRQGAAYLRFSSAHPGHYDVMFRADLFEPDDAYLAAALVAREWLRSSSRRVVSEQGGTEDDAGEDGQAASPGRRPGVDLAGVGQIDQAQARGQANEQGGQRRGHDQGHGEGGQERRGGRGHARPSWWAARAWR